MLKLKRIMFKEEVQEKEAEIEDKEDENSNSNCDSYFKA
jgi:hypothetical protein